MVFAGYSSFLHYLQLASHELATIWHKSVVWNSCTLKNSFGIEHMYNNQQNISSRVVNLVLNIDSGTNILQKKIWSGRYDKNCKNSFGIEIQMIVSA